MMYIMFKAAVYVTVIIHVLLYVNDTRALRKAEQNLYKYHIMRMLRWMMGIKRIAKISNEEIRARACVANRSEKIREARLI